MMERWLQASYEPNLVSVIIPGHNQERFLPAGLKSVTLQDYQAIDVIIVDDVSSDGTSEIYFRLPECEAEEKRLLEETYDKIF